VHSLDLIIGVALFWLLIGFAGLLRPLNLHFVSRLLFPLGAVGAVVLVFAAVQGIVMEPAALVLPLGLPDLPFHVRLDALSAFFVGLLGLATIGISLFSSGYFRQGQGTAPGLICLQYHVFLSSMVAVFVADDAYLFMVAWETMALASYFLVTTSHKIPEIRRAGFLYLLIAHIGAIAVLLCFGVMHGGQGDYTFAAMRESELSQFWSSIAFMLALFGFGAKAGLLPLHAWLPEAHPAAPSPVSALMSGVMLKTAVFGILRVTFDLLQIQLWWWGMIALVLGLLTAVYGVMFAAVQTDMKRLLAYSSIENIGVILVGIGLTIIFHAYGNPHLAALSLLATLYHCLNHACFKSLLFLATGSVLHSSTVASSRSAMLHWTRRRFPLAPAFDALDRAPRLEPVRPSGISPSIIISSTCGRYRRPLHSGQRMNTSLRNCISIFSNPAPRHFSHCPVWELKLKALAFNPLCFAGSDRANSSRMASNAPT
jgi:formate hydrogenlyase subunit 3/multisubunit Na+/H+ antiporter MnhD subunit